MEEFNLKPTIDDNISINYHGELMENYFPESIIDSGKGINALMYKPDKAMVFFIDKDHRLNLIINIDDAESGWVNYKLSSDGMEAIAFDIHHNKASNSLRIVYSIRNNNISQLYVSNNIKLGEIDPKRFKHSIYWAQQELNDNSRVIDHISINGQGVLYSTSYKTSDAKYVYFRYGEESVDYTLPENTEQVIQLEVGQIYGEFGVFLLYGMKHGSTMLFQSFPDEVYNKVSAYRFSTDKEINAFSTLDNDEANSILYLAGDGLFKFENPDSGSETISEGGQGIKYSKIVTAVNGEEVSIWTIGEKESKGLYYCTNRFYKSSNEITNNKWTTPLMMHNDVEEFACIKGENLLNQLFLFGNDGNSSSLIHFWQDKVTTHWYEFPVHIEALEKTKKLETFTVNVQFSCDTLLRSFHNEKVKISAEYNISVYVNERKVSIGPNNSFEASIEHNQINIVYPTKSIAVPVLFLEADFIDGKFPVDPAHKLKEKLKDTFSNKEKLRKAKKQNGGSLISPSISDEELEQVTSATTQIFAHLENIKSESQPHTEPYIPFASGAASMTLAASFYEPTPILGDVISEIGSGIGEVWHCIEKGFTKVTNFIVKVVEDGVEFVIEIGKKVIKWISKKASDVWQFLQRVWEKLKVFFKDVFDYLGFLFKWDDILETKEVFKEVLNNGFDALEKSMDGLKKKVTGIADQLQIMLDSPELTSQYEKMGKLSQYEQKANQIKQQQSQDYLADPRANWISSKKGSLAKANIGGDFSDDVSISENDISIFTNLEKAFKTVWEEVEGQFTALIKDEITVGEFLKVFVKKVAAIIVEVVEELVNALLSLVKRLIGSAKDALNAEINIPLFSTLYKNIDPKGNCSVIDIMCLIIAIPFTATFKGISGKAPFKDTKFKSEFVNIPSEAFRYLLQNEHITPPTLLTTKTSFSQEFGLLGSSNNGIQFTGLAQTSFSPEFGSLGSSNDETEYKKKIKPNENWIRNENATFHFLLCASRFLRSISFPAKIYGSEKCPFLRPLDSFIRLLTVLFLAKTDNEVAAVEYTKLFTYFCLFGLDAVQWCCPKPGTPQIEPGQAQIELNNMQNPEIGQINQPAPNHQDPGVEAGRKNTWYDKVKHGDSFIVGFAGIGGIFSGKWSVQPWQAITSRVSVYGFQLFAFAQPFCQDPKSKAIVTSLRTVGMVGSSISEGLLSRRIAKYSPILSVTFSPNSKILAATSGYKTIKLWDVEKKEIIKSLEGHDDSIWSVSFSPNSNNKMLASGSEDGTIKLWYMNKNNNIQEIKTLEGHNEPVWSVSFSPNGKLLASVSEDRTIKLWDVSEKNNIKEIQTLFGHYKPLRDVSFSHDGNLLASAGGDKSINIWDMEKKRIIQTLEGHNDSVWSVSFSPDSNKMLASGSEDRTIKLWNVEENNNIQEIKTLEGHNEPVWSVSFSPDGKLLASASRDKTVKLWNVDDKNNIKEIKTPKRHNDPVWSVSFSDSKTLASGSEDKSIIIWDTQDQNNIRIKTVLT